MQASVVSLLLAVLLSNAVLRAEAFFYLFPTPLFDCRRVHPGYCCATRIRAACPALCNRYQCPDFRGQGVPRPSFGGRGLNPDNTGSGSRPQPGFGPPPGPPFGGGRRGFGTEGSVGGGSGVNPGVDPGVNPFGSIGIPGQGPSPFGSIGVPPGQGPDQNGPDPGQGFFPGPEAGGETEVDPFPTLVPEATTPSISSFIDERSISTATEEKPFVNPNGAVDGEIKTSVDPTFFKGKKKGVLPPPTMTGGTPDELVELYDYEEAAGQTDGSERAEGQENQPPPAAGAGPPGIAPPPFLPEPPPPDAVTEAPLREERFWTPAAVSVQRIQPLPDNAAIDDRTTVPVREAAGKGLGMWSFKVVPSGYKSEGFEVPPSEISQEYRAKADRTVSVVEGTEAGSNNNNGGGKPVDRGGRPDSIFTDRVGDLIGSFFQNKTAFPGAVVPAVAANLPSPPPPPSPPVLIETATQGPPCGVAPDFAPCVPAQEASKKLYECCKQRLMPPGCLELCRYDVTQPEIRRAFDQGKCGILNVAPFLECASGGNNNLACCRHRGLARKSGPQCEVFCNPAGGLGQLGLQHLACQNVIGDLLQCHHSGVRL